MTCKPRVQRIRHCAFVLGFALSVFPGVAAAQDTAADAATPDAPPSWVSEPMVSDVADAGEAASTALASPIPDAGTLPAPQETAAPSDTAAPESVPPVSPDGPSALSSARFGRKGQWAILGSSSGAGISSETFGNSQASFLDANLNLGVDLFVATDLSVGLDVELSYDDDKGYGATTLDETVSVVVAGGARFGINVPLGPLFSFYPRLTVGLAYSRSDVSTLQTFASGQSPPPEASITSFGPWVNLYVPVLVHVAPTSSWGSARACPITSRRFTAARTTVRKRRS
jgi:hypothetical protein